MKTLTTYILAAMLILTGIITYASNPKFSIRKSDLKTEILTKVTFAESVPVEAEFEDFAIIIEINFPAPMDFSTLAPETPEFATFEESTESTDFSFLAPETPKEASFDDEPKPLDPATLAPETPKEATFEDTLEPDLTTLAPTTPEEATFDDAPELDLTSLAPATPAEATFE